MSSAVDTSDSEVNTKPPPAPFSNSKSKSKKKRKPLPPQETINKIWSRFSAQKFSKATVILPFASQAAQNRDASKPPKPPQLERNNLLVSEDYERAVQECRARVKKLIKECRRVNSKEPIIFVLHPSSIFTSRQDASSSDCLFPEEAYC